MDAYNQDLLCGLEALDAPAAPLTADEMARLRAAVAARTRAADAAEQQRAPLWGRRWRMALAVAAACLALCAGAGAAWPQLQLVLHGDTAALNVESGQASGEFQPMQIGYVPAGYTLNWVKEDAENQQYRCEITNAAPGRKGAPAFITQCGLAIEVTIQGKDDTNIEEDVLPYYHIAESVDSITAEDLQEQLVLWTTDTCYYEACRGSLPAEEMLKIIQSITP